MLSKADDFEALAWSKAHVQTAISDFCTANLFGETISDHACGRNEFKLHFACGHHFTRVILLSFDVFCEVVMDEVPDKLAP